MTKFSENLKKYLIQTKKRQKELAKQLHLTEATICRYLSGEREPRIKTLIQMSKILKMSIDKLVGNER